MIEIHHLSKSFGGVPVLKDINLTIGTGEIHALVGANGSGKSTIVKILSGYHETVDRGEISIRGIYRPLPIRGGEVHELGISFVHQDLGLVEQMSLVDNVCLYSGYSVRRFKRIDDSRSQSMAADVLRQLGLESDPRTLVRDIGPTERVIVAVARATAAREKPGLLVLDEPTAAIPVGDIARIIDVVRTRRNTGWAILYISHRLDEVLDLADRVSILRDGSLVATRQSADLDARELSDMIIGPSLLSHRGTSPRSREKDQSYSPSVAPTHEHLEVSSLTGRRLKDLSFIVKPGEILGVTGPTGCGKSELGRILTGAELAISGSFSLGSRPLYLHHPRKALDAGIAYVPQDRARLSLIPKGSTRENISGLRLRPLTRRIRINRGLESENAKKWIASFGIVPSNEERPISSLSGGNQQKAVIARAVQSAKAALVLDDPTAGVDVGARSQIQNIIRELAASGLPIVLLSTELDELVTLCDRVIVLRGGVASSLLIAPFTSEGLARAVFAGHSFLQDGETFEEDSSLQS